MNTLDKKNSNTMAIVWTLSALIAASAEPIFVKIVYRGAVSPYQLLVLKTLFASLIILPLVRKFEWIKWKGIKRIASVSILLLLNNFSSLMALRSISAVVFITMTTTTPALIAIVNSLKKRDQLTYVFWIGFLMCFIGVLLASNATGVLREDFNIYGILFALCAMTCTIIYRTKMEDITAEFEPAMVSLYIFWINAVIVAILILPRIPPIPQYAWTTGAWIGFAAAIANVAFLAALNILGSTRVSIFNMLQQPLIIIAASFVLNEKMSMLQISGILLVLIGINLTKVKRLKVAGRALPVEATAESVK